MRHFIIACLCASTFSLANAGDSVIGIAKYRTKNAEVQEVEEPQLSEVIFVSQRRTEEVSSESNGPTIHTATYSKKDGTVGVFTATGVNGIDAETYRTYATQKTSCSCGCCDRNAGYSNAPVIVGHPGHGSRYSPRTPAIYGHPGRGSHFQLRTPVIQGHPGLGSHFQWKTPVIQGHPGRGSHFQWKTPVIQGHPGLGSRSFFRLPF